MDPLLTSLGLPTGVAGWTILQTKTPSDFPALENDPIVQQQIKYFEQNAPKATTAHALLSDPRLQDFVLTAYGLTSENGLTALMEKVLNSDTSKSNSFAAQMVSPEYIQIARAFNYGGTTTPATRATPSSATVDIGNLSTNSNFANFSGTFGGVSVSYVDLTHATTIQDVASTLQTAFRHADGNKSNITVSVTGNYLEFSDALGRGTAANYAFSSNTLNTGSDPVTASAPTNTVAGSQAVPASGGPAVTSSSFIQSVVSKYLEAQLEVVAGNQSNALRQARYAKQQLPTITNWNQVIADKPLANVIQTVLGLPVAFGALDITQQAQVYGQRIKISDFQNPTKLSKLLTRYMAMSNETTQTPAATAATLLDSFGSSKVINLTLPAASATSSISNQSTAALILSTAFSQG
ncbi:MAG: DUF1217 domain-containing protein [Alphaproteobacteria bacterium]|nr:DUF1217 domain-containing protein [Alphaproteobacteria bacterium]